MDVCSSGDGTSLGGRMGCWQWHPENRLSFSWGAHKGSGKQGTRRAGSMDLEMGRCEGGWRKKYFGDLLMEKYGKNRVGKVNSWVRRVQGLLDCEVTRHNSPLPMNSSHETLCSFYCV